MTTKEKIKQAIRPYYKKTIKEISPRIKYVREKLFGKQPDDFFNIPIIINNYNQYDYLIRLIKSLEDRGYRNIHILDNESSYPPLLEFYKKCKYPVYLLKKNLGYLAFWISGIYKMFFNQYFVYTDPDVVLCEECPADFMERFYKLLKRHPLACKAGFSLKIDDLPAHYPNREKVIDWESQFWEKEIEPGVYRAPIDTTFALYRPFTKNTRDILDKMMRTGFPYQVRHMPWYVDPSHLTENEYFYANIIQTNSEQAKTHWSEQIKDKMSETGNVD